MKILKEAAADHIMEDALSTDFGNIAIEESQLVMADTSCQERGYQLDRPRLRKRREKNGQRESDMIDTPSSTYYPSYDAVDPLETKVPSLEIKPGSRRRKSGNSSSVIPRHLPSPHSRHNYSYHYNDSLPASSAPSTRGDDETVQGSIGETISERNDEGETEAKIGYSTNTEVDQAVKAPYALLSCFEQTKGLTFEQDAPGYDDYACYQQRIQGEYQSLLNENAQFDQQPTYATYTSEQESNNQQALQDKYYTMQSGYTLSERSDTTVTQFLQGQITPRTKQKRDSDTEKDIGDVSQKVYPRGEWDPSYDVNWVSAERISAAVLSHHLFWRGFYKISKNRAEDSCERLCCDEWTGHFHVGYSDLCLCTYQGAQWYLIFGSDRALTPVSFLSH